MSSDLSSNSLRSSEHAEAEAGDGGTARRDAASEGAQQLSAGHHRPQWFLSKPRRWQQELIHQPWLLPVTAMHLAAVAIQRAWRSSWLRFAKPAAAALNYARTGRGSAGGVRRGARRRSRSRSMAASAALKQRYFSLLRRYADEQALLMRDSAAGSGVYPSYEHFCAAVIQGRWRARSALRLRRRIREYQSLKLYNVAAFEIQCAWRDLLQRRHGPVVRASQLVEPPAVQRHLDQDQAARMLQRAWRSAIDSRVYESLRDTIAAFRRSGDPFLVLRTVLPREAMLMDPAMQAHVRFRLGGSKFPPSIYFKIYTHGSVVDVGAFAPRNYAAERNAKRSLHPQEGWYEREENNGWRLLVARLGPGDERVKDEVERASSRRTVSNFHFSRLRRRQDLEQRRRRRTVQWMRKLYGLESSPDQHALPDTPGAYSANSGEGTPRASAVFGDAVQPAPSSLGQFATSTGMALEPRPPAGAPPRSRPRFRPTSATTRRVPAARPEDPRAGAAEPGVAAGRGGTAPLTAAHGLAAAAAPWFDDEREDFLSDEMLLEWSKKLDFDSYIENWKNAATSDGSDGTLPISTAPYVRALAPASC